MKHRCHEHAGAAAGTLVHDAPPHTTAPPTRARSAGAPVDYTCPMHPEVSRSVPGSCPICGMDLEPRVAAAEDGPSPELRVMARRFWIGLAQRPDLPP